MSKIIIVSNRLPIKIEKTNGELIYKSSEGGLATGLSSVYKQGNNVWIGWPGIVLDKNKDKLDVIRDLKEENMRPVFFTDSELEMFYEGFSNATIWPLFHYFNQYAIYDQSLFDAYRKANQRFCDAVVEVAEPGDIIWIHDF